MEAWHDDLRGWNRPFATTPPLPPSPSPTPTSPSRHPPATSPFFFFNDTATTEIYTLSLHDALPISLYVLLAWLRFRSVCPSLACQAPRSEEHTSELQSHLNLVCRLLLEKKKIYRCPRGRKSTTSQADFHCRGVSFC